MFGNSIEWLFTACVDLEESARRLYYASLLGPVREYTEDEVNRVAKGRRKPQVIQKVWDHASQTLQINSEDDIVGPKVLDFIRNGR